MAFDLVVMMIADRLLRRRTSCAKQFAGTELRRRGVRCRAKCFIELHDVAQSDQSLAHNYLQ